MSKATNRAEELFENWCCRVGITCNRIPTQDGRRTPDYKLVVNGKTIIAEVKDVEENREEKANKRRINEDVEKCGIGIGEAERGTPGKRIQGKINKSQISSWLQQEEHSGPAILVLHETDTYKHLKPEDVMAAMYGELTAELRASASEIRPGPMKSGGKRKMTEDSNVSISAIMTLTQTAADQINVNVYHNCHAKYPLQTLDFPDTRHQYKHPTLAEWRDHPHDSVLEDRFLCRTEPMMERTHSDNLARHCASFSPLSRHDR